jgi:hypothetical protein
MNRRSRCFLALLLLAAFDQYRIGAPAQPPPPVKPPAEAPTLALTGPAGIQRGSALELTLNGTNLTDPINLWTSFPARVVIPTDKNNGKNPGQLRVHLEVPKDVPMGFGAIRLATRHGVSNFRIFCIDDLPQVLEVDGNHSPATAQTVGVPCVVVGRADAETSDFFKISVKSGQRVSFEVIGRRLGSPLDPQISLIDPRSHRELAYSNDAPGLQSDARLTYTFREGGDYVVEIRDVTYGGGPDRWYRLRIGDFPCATTPIPMAVSRGRKVVVHFAGSNVGDALPVEVSAPKNPEANVVWVAPRGANGLSGWPVAMAVSDIEEFVEKEPNNEQARANRLTIPCGVTGQFQEKGDQDFYVFAARKGQHLLLEAQTHELFSPSEVLLTLKNAKGDSLASSNPAGDSKIDFSVPADGDYYLCAEHLNLWGGPDESYRVTIRPINPGFDLTLGLDRYELAQGAWCAIPIQTVSRRSYAGPIEVSLLGAPAGIQAKAVIPTNAPTVGGMPAAILFVKCEPNVPPGQYDVRVIGKAIVDGKLVIAEATDRAGVSQNLAGLPYPPPNLLGQVSLGVMEKPPFALVLSPDRLEGYRNGQVSLKVAVKRAPGFSEEIGLSSVGLPPNVVAAFPSIPKSKDETKVELKPGPKAPLGSFFVSVTGKANHLGKNYLATASPTPLNLALPFELKVETQSSKIAAGGKSRFKATVTRRGGYAGPITLEVRNLPAGVTAPKTIIGAGQTSSEIELAASAAAAPITKTDVNILGTATAAANQQNASGNFTIVLTK